jgi:hypothetical protein
VHGGDEDPADPLFFEYSQVPAFLVACLVGVAQDHGVPRGLGVIFYAAGHLGEERVRHVQDDQPEAAAPARPELARGAVRDEPQLLHGGLDAGAGQRPHQVGMIEHVGNRADRHPGQARHVLHARSHQPSGPSAFASPLTTPRRSIVDADNDSAASSGGVIDRCACQDQTTNQIETFHSPQDRTIPGRPRNWTATNTKEDLSEQWRRHPQESLVAGPARSPARPPGPRALPPLRAR